MSETKLPKLQFLCAHCRKQFERSYGISRILKRGYVCCSIVCSGYLGNPLDEFSPFKKHLTDARWRAREYKRECTITLEDLKNQWDKQEGICPYTGWKMVNPPDSSKRKGSRLKAINRASLDRKDSSKGYTTDNIEWVSYMVQCMKNDFCREEVLHTARAIVEHNGLIRFP